MRVGVNYPWFDYGWDFGLGPPPWRGSRSTPRWFDHVDEHLARLADLGITVVRWFVLGDGLTYGTDETAPQPEGSIAGDWRFDPPPLGQDVVDHFEELLRRFTSTATAGRPPMQLLPVFIDFHFCDAGLRPVQTIDPADPGRTHLDPGWVKGGRADAIRDPDKRARFLDEALDPLLRVSGLHREAIFAWEIINEPDWITSEWDSNPFANAPIRERTMREFLEEGKEHVRAAGFNPTIGFGSIGTLQRSEVTAEINQFHYYPNGRARLDPHTFDPRFPGIIGEFATAETDVWPDLTGTLQGVVHRLTLAAERGYPLALPWSFLALDRHTAWSPEVERDIQSFTEVD